MKCAGRVATDSIRYRSDGGIEPGCRNVAAVKIRGHFYCASHAPAYRAHYRVLDRILAIPCR
jgi:hypothetical protein